MMAPARAAIGKWRPISAHLAGVLFGSWPITIARANSSSNRAHRLGSAGTSTKSEKPLNLLNIIHEAKCLAFEVVGTFPRVPLSSTPGKTQRSRYASIASCRRLRIRRTPLDVIDSRISAGFGAKPESSPQARRTSGYGAMGFRRALSSALLKSRCAAFAKQPRSPGII